MLLFKSTPTPPLFLRPFTIYLLFNHSAESPNMAHEAPAASPTGPNVTTTLQDSLRPNQLGWLICTYVQALPSQNPQSLPATGAIESGLVRSMDTPMPEPRSMQMQPLLSYQIRALLQTLRQEYSILRQCCGQPVVWATNGSIPKPRSDQQAGDASQSDPRMSSRTASLKGFEHTFTCDEASCYHSERQTHATAEDDSSQLCSAEYQPQHGKPDSLLSEVAQVSSRDAFWEPQRIPEYVLIHTPELYPDGGPSVDELASSLADAPPGLYGEQTKSTNTDTPHHGELSSLTDQAVGKPTGLRMEVPRLPARNARPLQSGKGFAVLRSDVPGQDRRQPAQPPIDRWASFSHDVVEASINDFGIEEGPGQQTPANMVLAPGCDLGSSPYESELSDFGLPHLDGGDDGLFDWIETHPEYSDDPVLPPWSFEGQSPVGLASLQFEDVKAVQNLDLEPCISRTDMTDQVDPCHWKPSPTFSPQHDKEKTQSDTHNYTISGTLAPLDKTSLVPKPKTHPFEGVIDAEDRPTATESASETRRRTSQTRNHSTTASSQRGPNSPLQRNSSTTRQSSNNQGGHPRKARPGRAPDRQLNKSNTVPGHRDVSHSKRKLSNDRWDRRDSGPVGLDELAERKDDARLSYDVLHVPPLDEDGTHSAPSGLQTSNGGDEGEAIAANSALKSTEAEVKRHTWVSNGKRQRIVENISNDHASERPYSSTLDHITGGKSKMLHCFEPRRGLPEHAGRKTHPEENSPSKRVKFTQPRTTKGHRSRATTLKRRHRDTIDKVCQVGNSRGGDISNTVKRLADRDFSSPIVKTSA